MASPGSVDVAEVALRLATLESGIVALVRLQGMPAVEKQLALRAPVPVRHH